MHARFRLFASLFLGPLGLALAATCTAQVNTTPTHEVALSRAARGATSAQATPARAAAIERDYGNLPLSFEANQGQADPRVRFISRGSRYSLFLTDSAAVLALENAGVSDSPKNALPSSAGSGKTEVVRMELVGANGEVRVAGADRLSGNANYFVGNNPANWRSNIPTFAKVNYANVYDGIDLIYYGNQSQLEYDFVVAPGASPKPIRLRFGGADGLKVNQRGDLSVFVGGRRIVLQKPVVYQEIKGLRHPVDGRFTLQAKNSVGFVVGNYVHSQPLVIDPILSYSTYVGGASGSGIAGIAVDAAGNAYVTGTSGMNFPVTSGAFQPTDNDLYGSPTAFVAKLNAKGTALVYATYLGGTGQVYNGQNGGFFSNSACGETDTNTANYNSCGDYGVGIAVDSAGNAYVTGSTLSTDFPTTPGAFQTINNGDESVTNVFVTKLNPTGSALVYSTYLGGSGGDGNGDWPTGIALDENGNAFVAGYAASPDFPVTPNAVQPGNGAAWSTNAFVTRLNATGTALVYSTCLGGPGAPMPPWYDPGLTGQIGDGANGIAVDSNDNAYVAGVTLGSFPITQGAFETSYNGSDCQYYDCVTNSGFVAKLNPTGTALVYSTYLTGPSGSGADAFGIAVDSSGSAYVTGYGGSDYPTTPGAYQTSGGGNFITKLTPDGSALAYSTFFPASGPWPGNEGPIAVDRSGDVYVTGTFGSGLPITSGAIQATLNGNNSAFLSELDPTGSTLLFSSYLSGSGGSQASSLALGAAGTVYLAGSAGVNFPVTPGALQTGISGTGDGFVAKLNLASPTTLIETSTTLAEGSSTQPSGMADTFTATVLGDGGNAAPTGYVYFTVDGVYAARRTLSSAGAAVYTTSSLAVGTHNVEALYAGNSTFSFSNDTVSDNVIATATPTISPSAGKYVASVTVSLSDTTPGATIYYTTDGSTPTTASQVYTQPIEVTSGYAVIRAFANLNGYSPTPIIESAYSILAQTPAPILSPGSANVPLGQLVTITDAEPAATLRYTTDGSTPTTTSNWYHGPITITGPEIINAIAVSTGQSSSEAASASYTIYTLPPTFSPAPGKYVGTTPLILSDITPAPLATIHYTLDNSNPTASSPEYTGPIDLPTGYTVVKAVAIFNNGFPPTAIVQAAYTVLPQTPPPTFTPGAGSYAPGQTVTLTDSISNATIRYTTDGSTPTTKSPIYSKPIPLSGTETIQAIAIAVAEGEAASNPVSATYTPQ